MPIPAIEFVYPLLLRLFGGAIDHLPGDFDLVYRPGLRFTAIYISVFFMAWVFTHLRRRSWRFDLRDVSVLEFFLWHVASIFIFYIMNRYLMADAIRLSEKLPIGAGTEGGALTILTWFTLICMTLLLAAAGSGESSQGGGFLSRMRSRLPGGGQ